jgi:hypothetical protein
MGDFGDRLRQIQPAEERLDAADGKSLTQSEFAIAEHLTAEERKALGSLCAEVEKARAAEPPMLGLAEWKELLRRVRARLGESRVEAAERRALRDDVEMMGSRRLRFWARVAGVAGIVAAAAYYVVQLLAGA